jgi:hypothetical protein
MVDDNRIGNRIAFTMDMIDVILRAFQLGTLFLENFFPLDTVSSPRHSNRRIRDPQGNGGSPEWGATSIKT